MVPATQTALLLALPLSLSHIAAVQSQTINQPPVTAISAGIDRDELLINARQRDGAAMRANLTRKDDAINMATVERIRLITLDYAAINGEFSIEADKSLSLPGIGRIDINGMAPSELEAELTTRLSRYARKNVRVSIEIVRFRPYFITGMISLPGANEWKPGLNVVKAIALARGTVRPPSAVDDPVASLALQQSKTQLQFSLALLARLKAQRDNHEKIRGKESINTILATMPAPVRARFREFMTRQNAVLDQQRKLTLAQISGLERQQRTAEKELKASIQQEKALKAQLDISKSLLVNVEKLKNQKLVANSRYLSQRSELMNSQIRFAEAQSLTEQARSRVDRISHEIETLHRQHKIALNDRIEALQREVAQLEVSLLPTTRGQSGADNAAELSYSIARETPSGIVTLNAHVFSAIQPGDVIVVSAGGSNAPASAQADKHKDVDLTSAIGRIQKAIESSSSRQPVSGSSSGSTAIR